MAPTICYQSHIGSSTTALLCHFATGGESTNGEIVVLAAQLTAISCQLRLGRGE